MATIETLITKEWNMFTNVQNIGARASCQDDFDTFYIMRASQFEAWDVPTLRSYLKDLERAEMEGRNLPAEKYGYMMESTDPASFEKVKGLIPAVGAEKEALVEGILSVFLKQTEYFFEMHPVFVDGSRPLYKTGDVYFTSIETYTMGELKTYSEETLKAYLAHIRSLESEGKSIVYMIYENTVRHYGYESIEAMEGSRHN